MDDIHGVGQPELATRGETQAALMATLAEIDRGDQPAITPAAIAERIEADHEAAEGDPAWGFSQALRALDRAIAWEPALVAADANPERYRESARHIAGKATAVEQHGHWPETLREALEILARLSSHSEVAQVVGLLRRTPVPGPATTLLRPTTRTSRGRPAEAAEPAHVPTVLLRFTLEGELVSWPMALTPGRAYVLEAHTSVDAWPDEVERMVIDLESDVPPSVIERPTIVLKPGETSGQGYLVPKREIGRTDPVTFTPRVSFLDFEGASHAANVIGQRTLRVSTFDPIAVGVGQPMVALRIVELLCELDGRIKNLPVQDRRDLHHLLVATERFAALAIEREDLIGLDELGFQAKLKQGLVQDNFIGTRIQEAPMLGGGTTDLMLGRLVDELKISHTAIDLDDADRFVRQPTQYASAGDCPISVLTILDDSPKSDQLGIASNYMRWAIPRLYGVRKPATPSMVAVVIIPIGFGPPSQWSKLKAGEVEHGS